MVYIVYTSCKCLFYLFTHILVFLLPLSQTMAHPSQILNLSLFLLLNSQKHIWIYSLWYMKNPLFGDSNSWKVCPFLECLITTLYCYTSLLIFLNLLVKCLSACVLNSCIFCFFWELKVTILLALLEQCNFNCEIIVQSYSWIICNSVLLLEPCTLICFTDGDVVVFWLTLA